MPFLAEQMYQNLVRSCDPNAEESVHLTAYPRVERSRFDSNLDQEIELGRAIVALGRAARSEAKIPVRQPLPALSVTGEFGSHLLSEESLAEITDELNIREVKIVENVEQLARRIVRPNSRVLGPKLGKKFPEIERALREGRYDLDPDGSALFGGDPPDVVGVLVTASRGDRHRRRKDGRPAGLQQVVGEEAALQSSQSRLEISGNDVIIALEPHEQQTFVQHTGQSRVTGGEAGEEAERTSWRAALAVSLDTRITPELRAEGLARQIAHRVQTMRKDAGLQVSDRIRLAIVAPGAVEDVLRSHGAWIQAEVGATTIQEAVSPSGPTWSGDMDGQPISISLERV